MVSEFLLSPNRRRMASKVRIGAVATRQLRALGWMDYDGPAQITVSKHPRCRGWIIPGTDPIIDDERLQITGTYALGLPRTVEA
jgi:hypothetical protein